jgi:hypothetical protein
MVREGKGCEAGAARVDPLPSPDKEDLKRTEKVLERVERGRRTILIH